MNEEARMIAIRAIFTHYINNFSSNIQKTGDVETDGDAVFHAIVDHYELDDVIMREDLGDAEKLCLSGIRMIDFDGKPKARYDGSDYLMELCFQHFC